MFGAGPLRILFAALWPVSAAWRSGELVALHSRLAGTARGREVRPGESGMDCNNAAGLVY